MSGFHLIHTYSSDALAQGILKSFFALINVLMPLPRSEPVGPNRPRLSGKHGIHSSSSLSCLLSDHTMTVPTTTRLLHYKMFWVDINPNWVIFLTQPLGHYYSNPTMGQVDPMFWVKFFNPVTGSVK